MPRFHEVLQRVALSALSSSVGACWSEPPVPPPLDTTGLRAVDCWPLPGVRPAAEPDYVEVRSTARETVSRGTRCARATDRPRCEEDYAKVDFEGSEGPLVGQAGPAERQLIVATDPSGVRVMRTAEEVKRWLGPVDSFGDAVAVVSLAGYEVGCGDTRAGGVGEAADGSYRVFAYRELGTGCGNATTEYLLRVSSDGVIEELETRELPAPQCIGRKPEGLAPYRSDATGAVARWLAEAAHLEAASVASFERLAEELSRFGAPASLIDAARLARDDEVRHATMMGELARRHGVEPAAPVVAPFATRELEAFAIENAVEGCVYETFGAVVGLAQAERAADGALRRAMRIVARDEVRHGQLAWEIDAWVRTQLDAAAELRVRAAREEAASALLASGPPALDRATARALGVPTGDAHQRLAETFVAALSSLEAVSHAA